MAHIQLKVNKRTDLGHKNRKLRKSGIIPAVIYGKKFESADLQVSSQEFVRVYKQAGKTHVVDLLVDDSKKVRPCLIHDIHVHPVTGLPLHIDFLAVNLKEKIKASVPIVLSGEAPAVKELGAVLINPVQEVEVEALPDSIPSEIVVDITHLATMHDLVRVQDLATSEEYTIVEEEDLVIVALSAQTTEEETVTEEVAETTDETTQTES